MPTEPASPERFEDIMERLARIVERLEGGSLSLEESLREFEEGVRLSRLGTELLDSAERRVEMLLKNADGTARIEPFEEPSDDESP